ncbi:cyclic nucleotide-binding domain-containing protein, partial [bacterium]|nr:cyclic nucleotide-binding domain-containing protein [bacterium]
LRQIYWQLTGKGIQLVFSYLHEDNNLLSFLKDLRMVEKIGRDYFFDDTNMALEYCEDSLIERVAEDRLKGDRFVLQDFLGVEREDYETAIRMVDYVDQIHYKAGDLIVKQGDPGDSAYIISRGLAAVTLSLPDTNRVLRLVKVSYGTMFGGMTLLDREVRSANVEVVEDVSCFKITTDNFEKMRRDEPDLAMILMHAISKMLVERLRQANITISELER